MLSFGITRTIANLSRLPLPNEKLDTFSCLPEYALQNIVDNFKFIFRSV